MLLCNVRLYNIQSLLMFLFGAFAIWEVTSLNSRRRVSNASFATEEDFGISVSVGPIIPGDGLSASTAFSPIAPAGPRHFAPANRAPAAPSPAPRAVLNKVPGRV